MGNRAVIHVFDEFTGAPILHLYKQYDGSPSNLGKNLFDFLKSITMVKGVGLIHPPNIANGMGCLAAQIVSHFKDGPGGIYLVGPGDHMQDFTYSIEMENGYIEVRVWVGTDRVFFGDVDQFGIFCSMY